MLTEQHTKLRTHFAAYAEARTRAEKSAVFEDIADELSVHTTLEEELFYPLAYADENEQSLANALEEHQELKRRLTRLMAMTVGSEGFAEQLSELQGRLEEHLREEEDELFPRVRARMTSSDLEQLWTRMEVLFTREAFEGPTRRLTQPPPEPSTAW
jgi:iron-sulfur cluster repair protein YtfE (RIC family)